MTAKQQAIQDMHNDVPRNLLSYENMIVESLQAESLEETVQEDDPNMGTMLWF